MTTDLISPKYIYYSYQDHQFASQEELNAILKLVLMPETAWYKKVIHLVQVLAAVAVMWIRDRTIGRAMELEKQGYMIKRSQANKDELAKDPMDVERRPVPTP